MSIELHIWYQISFLQHDVRGYPARNWRENHLNYNVVKKWEYRDLGGGGISGAYLGFLQNYSWQRCQYLEDTLCFRSKLKSRVKNSLSKFNVCSLLYIFYIFSQNNWKESKKVLYLKMKMQNFGKFWQFREQSYCHYISD